MTIDPERGRKSKATPLPTAAAEKKADESRALLQIAHDEASQNEQELKRLDVIAKRQVKSTSKGEVARGKR